MAVPLKKQEDLQQNSAIENFPLVSHNIQQDATADELQNHSSMWSYANPPEVVTNNVKEHKFSPGA